MKRRTFLGMLGGVLAFCGLGGRSGASEEACEQPEPDTVEMYEVWDRCKDDFWTFCRVMLDSDGNMTVLHVQHYQMKHPPYAFMKSYPLEVSNEP